MVTTSADDIESHYGIGNDFYALWLDETLTYSAALWEGIDQHRQTPPRWPGHSGPSSPTTSI